MLIPLSCEIILDLGQMKAFFTFIFCIVLSTFSYAFFYPTGSPTLKSTFSQIVALSLQRSLHAAHSDPEAVVPLLNTLCSFLSGEEDLAHLTQLCKKDQSATLRNFQLAQVRTRT